MAVQALTFQLVLQDEHATEAVVQHCLYCRQPCETEMFSAEPMWCCSSCTVVCHMRCYQELHPDIPAADVGVSSDKNQKPHDSNTKDNNALVVSGHGDKVHAMRRRRSRSVEAGTSVVGAVNGTEDDHNGGSSSQGSIHQQPSQRKLVSVFILVKALYWLSSLHQQRAPLCKTHDLGAMVSSMLLISQLSAATRSANCPILQQPTHGSQLDCGLQRAFALPKSKLASCMLTCSCDVTRML